VDTGASRAAVHRATFHVTTAVAATSAIAPAINTPRSDAITCRRIAARWIVDAATIGHSSAGAVTLAPSR